MINSSRSEDRRDRTPKAANRTSLVRGTPKAKARFSKHASRYEVIKAEIHRWHRAGFEVAEYLREVRADKLYLGEYESYEEFCLAEFGWKRSQAHGLAAWGDMRRELPSAIADSVKTESQARALSDVKEAARPAVLTRIVKSGEPVTAKAITEAIRPRERKKKSTPVVIDVTPRPKAASKNRITLDVAECLVCETETMCLIGGGPARYCEPCISAAFGARE